MEKFLSLKESDMLATSEQDFLNAYFKGRYKLIPIDYVMKVRSWSTNRTLIHV
jgi:hypothetical protein